MGEVKIVDSAKLVVGEQSYEIPILQGTEGNRSLDISRLFAQTGLITMDQGFANTGSVISKITYIEGDKGELRYRGYRIEELAEKCKFTEVAYLLIFGELPTEEQLNEFRKGIRYHTLLHENMKMIFRGFPEQAHPMAILSSAMAALPVFYKDSLDPHDPDEIELSTYRALGKLPTMAAFSYKQSIGQPFIYPQNALSFVENFLYMMFAVPTEEYQMNPMFVKALNTLLILHADHGQNCSTSAVRMVGSSTVNMFSALSAGINALWGTLHGGANEACIKMLEQILNDNRDLGKYIARAKNPNDPFRLMGFGHRIYKNFDPRAKVLKKIAAKLIAEYKGSDPLFDLAQELEEYALKDQYFVERKLYPNVDFYSGIIYSLMGIPKNMFTVLFALGRLPGWIAHYREMHLTEKNKIHRPRQLYIGEKTRDIVPLEQR